MTSSSVLHLLRRPSASGEDPIVTLLLIAVGLMGGVAARAPRDHVEPCAALGIV